METWVWLLAYLLGFALLQLYLYRYFIRSTSTESHDRTTPLSEGRGRSISAADAGPDEDLVACESCGAYNENHPMYSFCRECGARLS
ncbi:hypothetical protein SAMN05216226_105206 [Halovenus aranensis]|jgi:hypothetical protein|uniref:DUF7577 domain-containing protein n=1 Tax=Halovenus aranensis TaxID=890420 RepID=A0A1G8UZJ4_9EURY|nr:hypothetical protein [Halovenus aranensis]SDJ59024.1 hypothetical protein SAMN05216226_105206 [Halovenus aranensis]